MDDRAGAFPREEGLDDVVPRVSVPPQGREAHPFATLPEPVAIEDMVTEHDTDPGPDPYGGRDTEIDFLLRNALP